MLHYLHMNLPRMRKWLLLPFRPQLGIFPILARISVFLANRAWKLEKP